MGKPSAYTDTPEQIGPWKGNIHIRLKDAHVLGLMVADLQSRVREHETGASDQVCPEKAQTLSDVGF